MNLRNIFFVTVILSGCASATHGPKQRVMVSTPGAPRAECVLTSQGIEEQRFTTPEAIEIPRSSETIQISCHKKCFRETRKTFAPVINSEDLASNGFLGIGAPIAIDLATNKYYNYNYDFIIQLQPDHRCRSNRKGILNGEAKDFDDQIEDFSFEGRPKSVPERAEKSNNSSTSTPSEKFGNDRKSK